MALDSMDNGVSRTHVYCLKDGIYELIVEEGDVPNESEWHLCGGRGKHFTIIFRYW